MPCQSATATNDQLDTANIPIRFRALDMGKYRGSSHATDLLRKYCSKLDRHSKTGLGLFLRGAEESGKTLFGCNVLLAALSEQRSALYTTLFDITDNLLRKERSLKDFVQPQFLFVDGLNEEGGQFEKKVLHQLISLRKDYGKPTVLSTPLSVEAFDNLYGVAIGEILRNYCLTIDLTVDKRFKDSERSKRLGKLNETTI